MPRISVVIPTFNRVHTLGRAIASVLGQGFWDFELIIVDDGSTDETAELVAGIRFANLRLIRGTGNRGANWARNEGVRASRGEIICFLDSDDEFLPDKLAYVAEYFERRPEIDVLLDSYERRTDTHGEVRPRVRVNPVIDDPATFRSALFTGALIPSTPSISARRRALLEIGLFDVSLRRSQDLDLVLRLARAHRCATTTATLWLKHDSTDAISANRSLFVTALMAIAERHPEYCGHPSRPGRLRTKLARHLFKLANEGAWRELRRDLREIRASRHVEMPLARLSFQIAVQILALRFKTVRRAFRRSPSTRGGKNHSGDRARGLGA
jgi:glycosyltransferase involved in cell wall biosynthesis